jgi:hypothetical protein
MTRPQSSFSLRNADGTSTTYKVVHDDGGSDDVESVASSLPPEILLGGGSSGISSSSGGSSPHNYNNYNNNNNFGGHHHPMDASSVYYGHNTYYSGHHQHPQHQQQLYNTHPQHQNCQPPVVILKSSNNSNKRRKKSFMKCSSQNKCCYTSKGPICIAFGVLLSLLVMAGYASLIVLFIPGSTKNRWNEKQSKQEENDVLSEEQGQQQHLTTQEILRSGATSLTSSTNDGVEEVPRGHSYNAIVTILDPIDDSGKSHQEYGQVVSFTNKGDNNSRVSRKSDDTGHEGELV